MYMPMTNQWSYLELNKCVGHFSFLWRFYTSKDKNKAIPYFFGSLTYCIRQDRHNIPKPLQFLPGYNGVRHLNYIPRQVTTTSFIHQALTTPISPIERLETLASFIQGTAWSRPKKDKKCLTHSSRPKDRLYPGVSDIDWPTASYVNSVLNIPDSEGRLGHKAVTSLVFPPLPIRSLCTQTQSQVPKMMAGAVSTEWPPHRHTEIPPNVKRNLTSLCNVRHLLFLLFYHLDQIQHTQLHSGQDSLT